MTDLTMSQFASKDDLLAAQAARIAELEAQLEAIGAGGVEPLRKPAAAQQACCRSHPHEEMTPMCELRTEIARLTNALARAEAAAPQAVQAATQPAAQGMEALTPAARDVLAERKRQIEAEGWKTERDDVYDTGEMALAAACYAAHSASCAAIKAPHTAPGVFVRTRSAQDFVGEMWPWSYDWWKPSGHRRNLEKAGALILAEIERIDRAALAAQAKQGGAANG